MEKVTRRSDRAEYVSLSAMLQNTQVYERMPVMMKEALKKSVWLTLGTDIGFLVFLLLFPSFFGTRVWDSGFFIWDFTEGWFNSAMGFSAGLTSWLATGNLVSLLLVLGVLAYSEGMTKPVEEPVHWAAAAGAVPTGFTLLSLLMTFGVILVAVVINLVTWIIIISVVLSIIGAMLSG